VILTLFSSGGLSEGAVAEIQFAKLKSGQFPDLSSLVCREKVSAVFCPDLNRGEEGESVYDRKAY